MRSTFIFLLVCHVHGSEAQNCYVVNASQIIYIFKAIPVKILQFLFVETDRLTLKFTWKIKEIKIAKAVLKTKRSKLRTLTIDYKTYYKATVIMTAWHWHKDRYIDQQNNI